LRAASSYRQVSGVLHDDSRIKYSRNQDMTERFSLQLHSSSLMLFRLCMYVIECRPVFHIKVKLGYWQLIDGEGPRQL
jgi:hypothetical protein